MNKEKQNIDLALFLESLEDDFDPHERARILEVLKKSNPTDEALFGAKLLLEKNNWDYTVLKKALTKSEKRIDNLVVMTKQQNKIKYLKYAAVLIPIGFALAYFVNQSLTNKQNIEQFYIKDEGLPNYMGTEETNWENLMELYRANKMKEAYIVSEKIIAQKPQNDTALYLRGVISYELKKYRTAESDFFKITEKEKSIFYYDAIFRLGFVFNNLGKLQTAKQQFEKISKDSNNPFNDRAKVILEQF